MADKESVLGTTGVMLLKKNSELVNLHNNVVDRLVLDGAIFNTPEFTKDGFLPHSTVQKTGNLYSGDVRNITTISLIDMFSGGDWRQRKILRNFKLKIA